MSAMFCCGLLVIIVGFVVCGRGFAISACRRWSGHDFEWRDGLCILWRIGVNPASLTEPFGRLQL